MRHFLYPVKIMRLEEITPDSETVISNPIGSWYTRSPKAKMVSVYSFSKQLELILIYSSKSSRFRIMTQICHLPPATASFSSACFPEENFIQSGILTSFFPLEKIWMWSCTLEENILPDNSVDQKPIWFDMTLSACLPASSEWMISESLIERNFIDHKPHDALQFSNIFSALMLADVVFLEFLGGYRITHGLYKWVKMIE